MMTKTSALFSGLNPEISTPISASNASSEALSLVALGGMVVEVDLEGRLEMDEVDLEGRLEGVDI